MRRDHEHDHSTRELAGSATDELGSWITGKKRR